MEINDVLQNLPPNLSGSEKLFLQKAYDYAERHHEGQTRRSGEAYISHCVAVAQILVDLKLPTAAIAAGLLHDVVEDTPVTVQDLVEEFNQEVATMVNGVTKITQQVRNNDPDTGELVATGVLKERMQAETIRKTILAMHDDVRIMLIKLADRLHNMRTLMYMRPDKQVRIARETMEIFAPVANRLGIWQIKWELEDLSFRYLENDTYKNIAKQLNERRSEREATINAIIDEIESLLEENDIRAKVYGRPKHIYSIWKKMERKGISFDQLFDVRGIRVIVQHRDQSPAETKAEWDKRERSAKNDCYVAIGVVHNRWPPIRQEWDDYIGTPKDNFYRSLHTAVIADDGKTLEVQVRTEEMHQEAEYGIAAHWRYKEGGVKHERSYEKRIEWLRSTMAWRDDISDGQDFIQALKSDVFPNRVYTFSPKGQIIDLPTGATPIDFAYHIHTSVGERCRGSKVNGKLVSLNHKLKSGDQVEILTAKRGGPSRDWLNPDLEYVASARARSKIRAFFKKQDRDLNLETGRNMLDRELKRFNLPQIALEDIAKICGFTKVDEFFIAIGAGELHPQSVLNKVVRYVRSQDEAAADQLPPVEALPRFPSSPTGEVRVMGAGGMMTSIAKCCSPVPGDDIIGYTTQLKGVTVHRSDCPNMLHTRKRERLIEVSWTRGSNSKHYHVPIKIIAYDRRGLLRDISTLLTNLQVNMTQLEMPDISKSDYVELGMTLEVERLDQLHRAMSKISQLKNVIEVRRTAS